MGLDIRIPIGLLFAVVGVVLILAGVVLNSAIYQSSLGINVNLWWGLVMLVFGAVMIFFGRRGGSSAKLAAESKEGRKIEEMEYITEKKGESAE